MAQQLPLRGPVYEFGSYLVKGQEQFADLRGMFPGMEYVGCDLRPGPGVDAVMDLRCLPLADGVAGTVLCLDTLEHVEYVRDAMREMHRVLDPGGFCIVSSVMNFPIHDHPSDFWRFTPHGFESLLGVFNLARVCFVGKADFPHTVLGVAAKGDWFGNEVPL
jgi:SAM-dependent methyltransferase